MTLEKTSGTSLKMWMLALVAVFGIAAATFSVHRYLVDKTIADAKPKTEERNREIEKSRNREKVAEDQLRQEKMRTDTLVELLGNIEKVLVDRPMDSLLVLRAANICYDLGQFEKAEKYYRRFIKDIDNSSVSARIDLAYVVFMAGRKDEGVTLLKDVLRRDPKNQMAMFNLAFMFDQLGDKEKAKEWIEKCAKVDSTSTLGRNAKRILAN